MTTGQMLLMATMAWASGLGLTLSLYSILALMRLCAGPELRERMKANRAALTLQRPQIKTRPLRAPLIPASLNGHKKRDILVGMPKSSIYPYRVEKQ